MADNRKRFSPQELEEITKSGALAFIAAAFDVTEESLVTQHTRSSGAISGPSTTKQGRRDIVVRLQALSDSMFTKALEKGFVGVLGQAWGITERRVAQLRASNYSDTRTPKVEAAAPAARFHSHDGRKSHPVAQAHRS